MIKSTCATEMVYDGSINRQEKENQGYLKSTWDGLKRLAEVIGDYAEVYSHSNEAGLLNEGSRFIIRPDRIDLR
jgi:hypothetical protein